ncbi:Flavoprotein [Haloechinothrix alba]|uniref:Flavoprotein n=1 Tax=Haloechinothrix alba TaxID=664784 RepID=A0A238W5D3_9PSEU|nr:flavoprotein [Haloechinothrix alba]SNR41383.1 Flavoprotein [Haloechinothrix alba]
MTGTPVLAVTASAAGGLGELRTGLVEPALAAGWRVTVTLTPTAATWLDDLGEIPLLEHATGLPVRSRPRLPRDPRPHPDPDCCVVAPASANTVAKAALGIADNQALTQLCEALGMPSVPVVLFPRINAAHARHPAWRGHHDTLHEAGVWLVEGADVRPLHEPGQAPAGQQLPWQHMLDTAARAVRAR